MSTPPSSGPVALVEWPTPKPQARRFLVAMGLTFAIVMSGVAALNYTVDPYDEYAPQLLPPVRPDYVAEKLALLQAMEPPDILTTGSSRAFSLASADAAAAWNGTAFNFASPGGRLQDDLALYRYLADQGAAPQVLVVPLDLRLMVGSHGPSIRESRASGVLLGTADDGIDTSWTRLFSVRTTDDSVRVVGFALGGFPEARLEVQPGGEITRPRADSMRARGVYPLDTFLDLTYNGEMRPVFRTRDTVHPANVETMKQIAEAAQTNGTTLYFYVSPVHPEVLARLQAELPNFDRTRASALQAATAWCGQGVHVHDMTDISSFGGGADDFYDGEHFGQENGRRLIVALASGVGDLCAPVPDEA